MGGRGSSSGIKMSPVEVSRKEFREFHDAGWDYRGITEVVNKIENELETLRNHRRASSILRAIDNQLVVIQAALNDNEGNQAVLLSSRRRLRQLRRRLTSGDYGEF